MSKFVHLETKIEIPMNATQAQIENWIHHRLNVTSEPLEKGNPLENVELEATSVYDIHVSKLVDEKD